MSSSVHVLRRWLRPGCCRLQQPCQIQFRILDGTRRVNWSNPAASSKPQASSGSKATSGQPCTPSSLLPGPAISIVCSTRWMSMCNSGRQDWTAMAGYGATCPNNSRFQLQVRLPLAQPRQLPRYLGNWSLLWSGLPPQSQRTQYRTTTNLGEVCRGRDMSNSVLLGRLEEGQHRRVVTEYGST